MTAYRRPSCRGDSVSVTTASAEQLLREPCFRQESEDRVRVSALLSVRIASDLHEPPQAAARSQPRDGSEPRSPRGGPIHLLELGGHPWNPRNLRHERGTPAHPLTSKRPFPRTKSGPTARTPWRTRSMARSAPARRRCGKLSGSSPSTGSGTTGRTSCTEWCWGPSWRALSLRQEVRRPVPTPPQAVVANLLASPRYRGRLQSRSERWGSTPRRPDCLGRLGRWR